MNGNGKIPFLDLVTPHVQLEDELIGVVRNILQSGAFVGGMMVEGFERDFAETCETRYCVGVANGTDALRLVLIAAGVRKGDTVVTVPNTFIATAEAISQAGARPDFVDVDERTYNMDPHKLREYLEKRCNRDRWTGRLLNYRTESPVTAIVPVHLYGQMADMDPILELAEEYGLLVIEDACQAHGASYSSRKLGRWKRAGSMGVAGAFSFYPGKNLGACGEAGAVTTDDTELAEKVRMLRDHGQRRKYCHVMEGYNSRLDAIQAGILQVKLKHLKQWNEKRRAIARRYDKLFRSQTEALIPPYTSPQTLSVYHLYVVRVENRERLQVDLGEANIATQIHYPIPLHIQSAYACLNYKEGDFPVAEKAAKEILSLPMYPQLTHGQQERVVREVIKSLWGTAAGDQDAQVPLTAPLADRVA